MKVERRKSQRRRVERRAPKRGVTIRVEDLGDSKRHKRHLFGAA